MTKRSSLFALVLAATVSLGVAAPTAFVTPAYAAQTVSAKVGKPLKAAQELAKQGKVRSAIAKAKEAEAIPGKTKYEDFVINDFLAYLYTRTRDYRSAAHAYEAALNSGQAPSSSVPQRIKTLAQLYYQVHDYTKAISFAKRYEKQIGSDAAMELLVAQAYYQKHDYKNAMNAAQVIVNRTARSGRPDKHALNMVLSSAYQVHDNNVIKNTLFKLVTYYPNGQDWNRLITLIHDKGGFDDQMNLALQHLEMRIGLFTTGDQYFNLGKLAIALEIPGDAEQILQTGFQKKLLGNAPGGRDQRLLKLAKDSVAKDKAGLADRAAQAKASSEPKDEILLGLAYASYGQYDKAIAAINTGMTKAAGAGDEAAEDIADAYIALGRVYLMAGNTAKARQAFRAVKGSAAATDLARMWLVGMNQHH